MMKFIIRHVREDWPVFLFMAVIFGWFLLSGEPRADVGSVSADPPKLDSEASDGLLGTPDSVAYRVHETERHWHVNERWFHAAAAPTASSPADRAGSVGVEAPFVIDAGNGDWGDWLRILGTADTPADSGMVNFDPHRLNIQAAERNSTYILQLAYGDNATAAVAAGDYTEMEFTPSSNVIDSGPVCVRIRRIAAGTPLFARTKCSGQNTATIDFTIGIHEYEG